MHARDTSLHNQQHIISTKAQVNFSQFGQFREKVKKVRKTPYIMHNSCLLMHGIDTIFINLLHAIVPKLYLNVQKSLI